MNKFHAFLSILWLVACAPTPGSRMIVRDDFGKYFEDFGLEGSFILYDLNREVYTCFNPDQRNQEFPPASTFKICNSLIGLETGVISDEHQVFPWDSAVRDYAAWNQDLDLTNAFRYSAVWFYQELARQVGPERMQHWIDRADYGNRQTGGGIDQFWLRGDLRITPARQIDFLIRLYKNQLPFSSRNMEIVKRIMIVEETRDYTLRAKTGWALINSTGWYVGYIEKGVDVYFFATCVQGTDFNMENFGKARIEITRSILNDLGIIPITDLNKAE